MGETVMCLFPQHSEGIVGRFYRTVKANKSRDQKVTGSEHPFFDATGKIFFRGFEKIFGGGIQNGGLLCEKIKSRTWMKACGEKKVGSHDSIKYNRN